MDILGKTSSLLKDNFGRIINYLRLAVTDRCNLRCLYCMPEEGVTSIFHKEILSYEEFLRLIDIFSNLGINKLRITGGEPFARKGLINFIESIRGLNSSLSIYITTNGVLISQYLQRLKELNINGINLSLDTLNKEKFRIITQRDLLNNVLETLEEIIKLQIPLKINTVVSKNSNINEITKIAGIANHENIEVRFIEKMPFDGKSSEVDFVTDKEIFEILQKAYPGIIKLEGNNSTADLYSIPGFRGKVGIIGSYTRSFCSSCNRIRITPQGMLKTCLYDNGVLDLREMLRTSYSDDEIKEAIISCVNKKYKNGFEVETVSEIKVKNSMSAIGG